ncbi:MAG: diphthamide synthesis protein [Candidatus Woesearchaeota archaeon]
MKTAFLKSSYKENVKLGPEAIKKLPEKIALATTIQFIGSIENIKKDLESYGKKVILMKGAHSSEKGQMLGCDITRKMVNSLAHKDSDCYLFIGDGLFHPKLLLLSQEEEKRPLFSFNPITKEFFKVKESEIKNIERRYKGALLKYHTSKNIGIIVSTKPGQSRLNKAIELKKKLKKEEINAYIFICNTLDFNEMENFNFIECFVNTMCPRINYDDYMKFPKPVISYEDIE